jgi:hypothetical protein
MSVELLLSMFLQMVCPTVRAVPPCLVETMHWSWRVAFCLCVPVYLFIIMDPFCCDTGKSRVASASLPTGLRTGIMPTFWTFCHSVKDVVGVCHNDRGPRLEPRVADSRVCHVLLQAASKVFALKHSRCLAVSCLALSESTGLLS